NKYVYNWCGLTGITQISQMPDSKKYFLDIEGKEIPLKGQPIKTFAFELPEYELVSDWVQGNVDVLEIKDLWKRIRKYFEVFSDLQDPIYYDVLVLFVLQSWLAELFNTVFYVVIAGQWGGGKTTLGELTINLCKHGYSVGNPSVALIGRILDRQKITLFIDELDSIQQKSGEDSDLYSIIRQGYRKGVRYSRINKVTMEPEDFAVFGPKIFSVHTDVEPALATRSVPITTSETSDENVPLINIIKKEYGRPLFNKLFVWYLENGIILAEKIKNSDSEFELSVESEVKELRKLIRKKVKVMEHKSLFGRNAELAYNMIIISELVGINMSEKIEKIFDIKKQIEEERLEVGYAALLRDYLKKLYDEKKKDERYICSDGLLKVSNKEMYEGFNKYLKASERAGVSPSTFQGYLREFGFERPVSRKRMRIIYPGEDEPQIRLCNIYTPAVMNKLGLKVENLKQNNEASELEVIEEQIKEEYVK
ncbi:MAG: hypothetical protein D6734_07620, partial [Candidatus Schekmanbacteria bacterium]